MSQIHKGIFGALAVALTLGAAQFASGHDLIGGKPTATPTATVADAGVNRATKSDRADLAASPAVQTQTMALKVDSLAETSILVRVPVPKESRARPASPSLMQPGKTAVACEPMVSVLTEVAKMLQPGRCVT